MVATFGLRHRSPQSLAVVSMFACGLLSGYDSSLAFSYPELQMLLTFRDFDEVLLVVLRPSVVGGCGGKSPRHPYVVSGARCMGRRTPSRVCAAPPMTVSPCRRRP